MDSLMGQSRNTDLKEAKKKKGQNFKEPNVCKAYLLGFCLQHEDFFRNTKKSHLQIGDCDLIHSDALREEFLAHPQTVEYEAVYTKDVLRYLENMVRRAEEVGKRQEREMGGNQQEGKELSDTAKRQIDLMREECNNMLKEAEELAEKGDVEGSKAKTLVYEEQKKLAAEYEEKAKFPYKVEICEVCGTRNEVGDGVTSFTHVDGRIHRGFVKIREWIKKLRERTEEIKAERKKLLEEGVLKDEAEKEKNADDDKDGRGGRDRGTEDRRRDDRREDDRGDNRRGHERDDRRRDDRDDRRRDDRDDRRRDDRRGDDRGYARDGDRDERRSDRRGGDRDYRGGDRGRGDDRGYDDRGARGRDNGRGGNDDRGRSRSRGRGRY